MPVTVLINASATGQQAYVIQDASPFNDGVMTSDMVRKLNTLTPGAGSSAFIIANAFPGADLTAKVQAANDFLGDVYATIYVQWGADAANNTFSGAVAFNSNKTLYLGPGFFNTTLPDTAGQVPFLVRDNFTLVGSGWDTIIQQPTRMTVIAPHDETIISGDLPGSTNLSIANFQVVTPAHPRPSTGGESAIAAGNSVNVYIENVFFNGCYGIDWTLGGNANPIGVPPTSYHCDNATVINCVSFNNKLDDNIKGACVNARSWKVIGCSFLNGATFDIEQNTGDDDQSDFVVTGCLFHKGGSLLIQGPQGRYGNVSGNLFEGHGSGANAISLNGSVNVKVVGNYINGYNGDGVNDTIAIEFNSTNNCSLENNTVLNCGLSSGPSATAPTIRLSKAIGSVVTGNIVDAPQFGWCGFHETADCTGTVFGDNFFGLGSGSTITVLGSAVENSRFGRISSASAGAVLPQATIFSPVCVQLQSPASGGSFTILTTTGLQTVTYTGATANSFTGCSGGTGAMFLGAAPGVLLEGTGSRAWNTTLATGDGTTFIKWSRDPEIFTSTFTGQRTISGAAQTATVYDSIIGVDTSTLACDVTLPDVTAAFVAIAGSTTMTGINATWRVTIMDAANNASVHNITIKRANPATKINGVAADKVISTNSGALTLWTNGTDYFAY